MGHITDWFGNPIALPEKPAKGVNPCLALYGQGPDGKRCKDCAFLVGIVHSRTFYKCLQRTISNGPATDHRQRWPACARFEQRDQDRIPLYDGR